MKQIVVLAYSGGPRSAAAVKWLANRHQADVVTLTLDLGQARDLADIRDHAMGANRNRHELDVVRGDVVAPFDESVRLRRLHQGK